MATAPPTHILPRPGHPTARHRCSVFGVKHDLRHTSATFLLEADVDLKAAGQVLGHVTIAQTAAYIHVLTDRKVATARAMDAFVFGSARGET